VAISEYVLPRQDTVSMSLSAADRLIASGREMRPCFIYTY
jgi:hypothetical protein